MSENYFNFAYSNIRIRIAFCGKRIVKRIVNECKFCFERLF
jgi:hypothetical protein